MHHTRGVSWQAFKWLVWGCAFLCCDNARGAPCTNRTCSIPGATYFTFIPRVSDGVSNSSDQWRWLNRCVDSVRLRPHTVNLGRTSLISWWCAGSELSFSRWLFAFSLVTTLFFTCEYRLRALVFF